MKLTEECKPLQTIVNKWDDWCSLIKLSLVWNLKQDISVREAPSFSSCFVLAHLHILFYLLNISDHCRLCYYYRPCYFYWSPYLSPCLFLLSNSSPGCTPLLLVRCCLLCPVSACLPLQCLICLWLSTSLPCPFRFVCLFLLAACYWM